MEELVYLAVFGTAICAGIDASNLGAKRGVLGGGFLDIGPAPATGGSTVNQLARLEALRDRGSLTPAEFETLKQQVLDAGKA